MLQVCRAYDAAEFCRNVHVDPGWRHQAASACSTLGGAAPPMHSTAVQILPAQTQGVRGSKHRKENSIVLKGCETLQLPDGAQYGETG